MLPLDESGPMTSRNESPAVPLATADNLRELLAVLHQCPVPDWASAALSRIAATWSATRIASSINFIDQSGA